MQHFSHDSVALQQAIKLSVDLGVAIYDAYLVALAERYGLIFVTADRRLWRRLSSLPFVRELDSFPL